jgi:hypothetical protein
MEFLFRPFGSLPCETRTSEGWPRNAGCDNTVAVGVRDVRGARFASYRILRCDRRDDSNFNHEDTKDAKGETATKWKVASFGVPAIAARSNVQ